MFTSKSVVFLKKHHFFKIFFSFFIFLNHQALAQSSTSASAPLSSQNEESSQWLYLEHKPTQNRMRTCDTENVTPIDMGPNSADWECVQWRFVYVGEDKFRIENHNASLFLAPESGQEGAPISIVNWPGDWTHWRFVPTYADEERTIPDGYGHFFHVETGMQMYSGGSVSSQVELRPDSWAGDYTRWTFLSAEEKSFPKGVYHSAGVIKRGSSVDQNIVEKTYTEKSYVNGTLLRVEWAAVHKQEEGAEPFFDFSTIRDELNRAVEQNSYVTLAVMDSLTIPDWLSSECAAYDFFLRPDATPEPDEADTTCIPNLNNSNDIYWLEKENLIAALAEEFDGHPYVSGIYTSYFAMTNGIEMHWRVSDEHNQILGDQFLHRFAINELYLADSYERILQMYANHFVKTPLMMELHEVFERDIVAERALTKCNEFTNNRCGGAIWWCAERLTKMEDNTEDLVWDLLKGEQTAPPFSVCQTIGNFFEEGTPVLEPVLDENGEPVVDENGEPVLQQAVDRFGVPVVVERFGDYDGLTDAELLNVPSEVANRELDFFVNQHGFNVVEAWTKDLDNENAPETASTTLGEELENANNIIMSR